MSKSHTRTKPMWLGSSGKIHAVGCAHAGSGYKEIGVTPVYIKNTNWNYQCAHCRHKFPAIAEVVWDE